MPGWVLPYSDLTPEQQDIVDLPMSQHRVVLGPPGSGKTQVLLHRASHLVQKHGIPPERYQVFLYTNVLKDYIRSGLSDLDLPVENVSTLDSWCRLAHEEHLGVLPWKTRARRPDFDLIRNKVLQWLERRRGQPFFDFVVVDEGQDLSETSFRILRLLAGHITVFADDRQQIYGDGATTTGIFRCLGLPERSRTLLGAYRNSPAVARLASYFLDDGGSREQYMASQHRRMEGRDKPLFFVANSVDEEMNRLAEVVKERVRMNQRVGIIVPKNDMLSDCAQALEERGVSVERVVSHYEPQDSTCDFQGAQPKVVNIYNAKGLTFDVVALPRLRNNSFWGQVPTALRRKLLFVAVSRAMEWVYLSKCDQDTLDEESILLEAIRCGDLHKQTSHDQLDDSEPIDNTDDILPY